jgi:hypothetical protein
MARTASARLGVSLYCNQILTKGTLQTASAGVGCQPMQSPKHLEGYAVDYVCWVGLKPKLSPNSLEGYGADCVRWVGCQPKQSLKHREWD